MSLFDEWDAALASRDAALAATQGVDFELAQVADDRASDLTIEMTQIEESIIEEPMASLSGIEAKLSLALKLAADEVDLDAICTVSQRMLASALADLRTLIASSA